MPPDSGSTLLSARSLELHEVEQPVGPLGADRGAAGRSSGRRRAGSRGRSARSSRVSSCGTTPSRARMRGPSSRGSRPSTRSVPPVTGETQPIMRMVEDLPAPLGPRKPNASPRWTSTSMPSTAVKSPKRFTSPRAWISGRRRRARCSTLDRPAHSVGSTSRLPAGSRRLRPALPGRRHWSPASTGHTRGTARRAVRQSDAARTGTLAALPPGSARGHASRCIDSSAAATDAEQDRTARSPGAAGMGDRPGAADRAAICRWRRRG